MLDEVIQKIIEKITNEVVTPQMDQIPLNYLMTRKIPDSVKHFFDQEVEIWLREESDKFTSNEKFDYEMPEVRVLIDKIFDILKQTANFHITKFNQLLERAIKLEANYLIRPHQTLSQFLFKDSFVITTMDVYDMLKYFDKFQYYKDALTDYFNLKYLREISQNQFEELITEIDRQVYKKDPVDTALKTSKSILNFFNEGGLQTEKLPTDILNQAFTDRGLEEYADLISKEEKDKVTELSLSELELLLRTEMTRHEREIDKKKEEEKIEVEKISDIETAKPEIEVQEIAVEAEPEIPEAAEAEVEEEYEDEYEGEYEEESEEKAPPATAIPPSAADQLADFVAEKIKGDSLADLTVFISRKQSKKFVKKVFKKDEYRYKEFIEFLNSIPSWKQASVAIDEMFYQIGVNPYSREALEFSDTIYNRYFPKDSLLGKEDF